MQQAELNYQVKLLHSTIQSQEEERKRIGRDMHDEVGGALANLRLAISNIGKTDAVPSLQSTVTYCQSLTDSLINSVRYISHNLSPSGLEIFGLYEILYELCERTHHSSGLEVALNNNAGDLSGLSANISIALYRVLQELLTNTIKHAKADKVVILINCHENALTVEYTDNGIGIDTDRIKSKGIGMGMYNIESRLNMIDANYLIEKGVNAGFKIYITIPLKQ